MMDSLSRPTSRVEAIDVAKGIAIIAMLMGHWNILAVYTVVYGFHMPLFFFLSGYTFKPKPWGKTLRDKSARLLLPYAATCAAMVALFAARFLVKVLFAQGDAAVHAAWQDVVAQVLASVCGGSGYNQQILNSTYIFPSVGPVWFLPALFFCILLLRALDDRPFAAFWVLLLAYVGYKMQSICILPLFMLNAMTALLFAYAGRRSAGILDQKMPWPAVILCAGIYVFCLWRFHGKIMELAGNRFPFGLENIIQAFAGIIVILAVSKWIAGRSRWLKKFLMYYGNNTLCVLFIHTLEKRFFPWWIVDVVIPSSGCWWVASLCIKVALQLLFSAVTVYVLSVIPFTKRIFRPQSVLQKRLADRRRTVV